MQRMQENLYGAYKHTSGRTTYTEIHRDNGTSEVRAWIEWSEHCTCRGQAREDRGEVDKPYSTSLRGIRGVLTNLAAYRIKTEARGSGNSAQRYTF